jgi:hypothetical protein
LVMDADLIWVLPRILVKAIYRLLNVFIICLNKNAQLSRRTIKLIISQ